ncbi:hypothetical protein [Ponticaulis koreensis]|uniref:hypothetical protein n=1 Tax=Ponticaulis koreensis TaxID=1123045 RepID=UPI0003B3D078|nr:hypothetical protein [Ponticaulis koreensis]
MQTGKIDVLRVVKDVWTLPLYRPGLVAIVTIFGFVLPDLIAAVILRGLFAMPHPIMVSVMSSLIALVVVSVSLIAKRYAVFELSANAVRKGDIFSTAFLIAAWPAFAVQFIAGLNGPGLLLSLVGSFFLILIVPVICVEELYGFEAAKRSAQMVWQNIVGILLCLFSHLILMLVVFFLMELAGTLGISSAITGGIFTIILSLVTAMATIILPVRVYDEIRSLER